ncbi:hypothetical protein MSU_0177 [Mycoplasma suis str. Illinois]|uniref:Uncharacterized protein n=1 Tax=Mycoplasma suis (strain Illinois) TaxID=768700 RepID=F0QQF1_MYCSL|nr:hypothetical protein MSU_0177 [Mycoplasma suis str. Illinois]
MNEFKNISESLEINSEGVQKHTLLLDNGLNSEADGRVIHQIMKEVRKDFNARTIQGNSQGNLKEAKEKVNIHNQNYEKVKKTIEEWKKKQPSFKESVGKFKEKWWEGVNNQEIKTFSKEEREALFLFYEKYTELREKKMGYSKQLKEVEEGKDPNSLNAGTLSSERNVLEALKKINWKEENIIEKIKEFLSKEKKEDNPLEALLKEKDYLTETQLRSEEWEKRLREFDQRHDLLRQLWGKRSLSRERIDHSVSILRKTMTAVESEVVLMIAERLINEMTTGDIKVEEITELSK